RSVNRKVRGSSPRPGAIPEFENGWRCQALIDCHTATVQQRVANPDHRLGPYRVITEFSVTVCTPTARLSCGAEPQGVALTRVVGRATTHPAPGFCATEPPELLLRAVCGATSCTRSGRFRRR